MLGHWRVLDLTDHRGEVAAFVLAELGADVIKVETPATAGQRDDVARFAAYNANKRSIVLDPALPADRAVLEALIGDVDVVFDCAPAGVLAGLGLHRAELEALNPALVTVIVTPFGLDGPRAEQPCSELTIAALGGPLRLQGTPHRPPVQISVPQVWRHTGAEAAVAAMVAHARLRQTGRSQFVDVSAQTAMTWTMLNAMEAAGIQGRDFERTGSLLKLATDLELCHAAQDGYVVAVPRAQTARGLLPWLLEEDLVGPAWVEEDWATFDHRCIVGEPTLVDPAELSDRVDALCARHTKAELLVRGLELGVTIAPINAVDDLLAFEQLQQRGFWSETMVAGRSLTVPGVAYRLDGQRPQARRDVPEADEHGAALRRSLLDPPVADRPVKDSPAADRPAERPGEMGRRRRAVEPAGGELPFSGLKVADFSWIGVGPITAKALADHGATVVRVESQHRIDGLRLQPPMKDGVFGIDRSNFYGAFNTSKLGLALDLKTEVGRATARRLTQWADVVIDSFTPGVMGRLGLSPEQVRESNPSVITVNTSLLGPGGSYSSMAGYGYHAAALAGFFGVVGWPDLPPDGPWLAYTDTICPRLLTPVLLAALEHRRRGGSGVHIEAAQLEMALQFLAPELVAFQLGAPVPTRRGNRRAEYAPQGVYPCRGDDEWCALTVPDDDAWRRLVRLLGSPGWVTDAMDDLAGRLAAHDLIDDELARWSASFEPAALEPLLCAHGIPAGTLLRSSGLLADAQLLHRGFYAHLDHQECGVIPYAGHQYRIAGYAHGPRWAAPCLGQHSVEVLTDEVGLSVDELADVAAAGALE